MTMPDVKACGQDSKKNYYIDDLILQKCYVKHFNFIILNKWFEFFRNGCNIMETIPVFPWCVRKVEYNCDYRTEAVNFSVSLSKKDFLI